MKKNLLIVILFLSFKTILSQAIWNQYQGPYMGHVISFTAVSDTLYAGVDVSGIFKSTDQGKSWNITGMAEGSINCMTYAGSKLIVAKGSYVYISEDNGLNWRQIQGLNGSVRNMNIIYGKVYAGTDYGVFTFDPLIETWTDKNMGLDTLYSNGERAVNCITTEGETLFAGTVLEGLYYSKDSANHWTKVPDSSGLASSTILLAADYKDTLVVIPNDASRYIYFSGDTGKTWSHLAFARNDVGFMSAVVYKDSLFISTTKGLFLYEPGLFSWVLLDEGIYSNLFIQNNFLFASNDLALYKWDSISRSLVTCNIGLNSARVYDVLKYGNNLFAAAQGAAYYTNDDGHTWTMIEGTKNQMCYSLERIDTTIFLATDNGLLIGSASSPNWIHSDNGITSKVIWDIDITDSAILVGTDDGIFASIDTGRNWNLLSSKFGQILKICHGNGLILAGNVNGLYRLFNLKDSLELVGFQNEGIQDVEVIGTEVYASKAYGGISKSIDTCKTWISLNNEYNHPLIYDIFKRGDENIYASSGQYIYYSPNLGKDWNNWSETGMPNLFIERVIQTDTLMYAATYGKSLYKRRYLNLTDCSSNAYTVSSGTIEVPENTLPDSIRQNIDLSHGASAEFNSSGKHSGTVIKPGDQLSVIAEDGITKKSYTFSINTGVAIKNILPSAFYPTLATDKIYFNYSKGIQSVKIFSIVGILYREVALVGNYVQVNDLPSGSYILVISYKDFRTVTGKFVKIE